MNETLRPTVDGLVAQYRQQLDVGLPVHYTFDERAITAQIVSDRSRHRIIFPKIYQQKPDIFTCDIAHELTHARLAEKIDVLFATSYFAKSLHQPTPENTRRLDLLGYTQRFIDIWIADEMAKLLGQNIVLADIVSYLHSSQIAGAESTSWVINRASSLRLGIRSHQNLSERLYAWLKQTEGKAKARGYLTLSDTLAKLPPLTYDPKTDLESLAAMTDQVIANQDLGIKATIINEDGDNVWQVE